MPSEPTSATIFSFATRDVADGLQQSAGIAPVDRYRRGVLDCFEAAPGSAAVDHLGHVEVIGSLSQRAVETVADAADRGLDPGLGKPLEVLIDTYRDPRSWSLRQTRAVQLG